MEILLDGNVIVNKETLFTSLKNQINTDDLLGNNLDALWDVLSYGIDILEVTIKNKNALENNLGDYFDKLLNLFEELNQTTVNVIMNFK